MGFACSPSIDEDFSSTVGEFFKAALEVTESATVGEVWLSASKVKRGVFSVTFDDACFPLLWKLALPLLTMCRGATIWNSTTNKISPSTAAEDLS